MDKNLPHPKILTCRDVGLWQSCTTASNENDGFDHVIDNAQNDAVQMFTVYNGRVLFHTRA